MASAARAFALDGGAAHARDDDGDDDDALHAAVRPPPAVPRSPSSSASSSSWSSSPSSASTSDDDDDVYAARPLPAWLLHDLAAVPADLGDAAAELTEASNRSSHTEVSIEIASVDEDSSDASLISLRSAPSLDDFSETHSDVTSGDGGTAALRHAALREMNEMRWSAIRQQAHASYNTGSELHRQGKVSEAVQQLRSALESAREAHDTTLEALILSRLGLVCNRAGKYSKAASLFKAALRVVSRGADAAEADAAGGDAVDVERAVAGAESAETTTCLLALQGLTQAYLKLGQRHLAAAAEKSALNLLPCAHVAAAAAASVRAGDGADSAGVGDIDPGEVRRRMATLVRRRLSEAQAAIPVVCRGLHPLAATAEPAERARGMDPMATKAGGLFEGREGWGEGGGGGSVGRIRSGVKCVTLLQEALDVAMQVEDLSKP